MAEDTSLPQQQVLSARLNALVDEWAKGQVTLKQILGLSEDELYAVASQGYVFFLQGKIDQARVLFEGLVSVDPRNAYYYRALGAIYWRLKEAQKALQQFGYAIRVAPNDIVSYIDRAEVYVANGQFEQARADLNFSLAHAKPVQHALANKARAILKMIE